MTSSEKQMWEKVRAKGKINYLATEGILRRGIFAGVIDAVFPYALGGATHAYAMPVWVLIVPALILSLALGIGFGELFWRISLRAENQLLFL